MKNKIWHAVFAKPWALKIHYKNAIKKNIININKIDLEVGIFWILIFILLIIL